MSSGYPCLPTSPPHFDSSPPLDDSLPLSHPRGHHVPTWRRPHSPLPIANPNSASSLWTNPNDPNFSPRLSLAPSSPSRELTADLSDLSLCAGSGPPGKIRRRNALGSAHDFFLNSRERQKLQDMADAALMGQTELRLTGGAATGSAASSGATLQPEDFGPRLNQGFSEMSLRTRKKAIPRSGSAGSLPSSSKTTGLAGCFKSSSRPIRRLSPPLTLSKSSSSEPNNVVRISLHKDLLNSRAQGQALLPEMILDDERKKSSQAVVLYKSPSKVVEEILAKNEDCEMMCEPEASGKS